MQDKIITSYINRITYNDISSFAKKNNIVLSNNEIEFLYNKIKNNYRTILYGNPDSIFNELKEKVDNDKYIKIKNLFYIYKEKYRDYL